MDEIDVLAERFERSRPHLHAIAYQMLGSTSEAEDAVQETWLRMSNNDTDGVENLHGWLVTVVGRISLNMLRSRATRREEPIRHDRSGPAGSGDDADDPERQAVLRESVGDALLIVLDTLTPAERLVLVLHDMFALTFEEIGPIVDRSSAATRKLASRARRRVQGATLTPGTDLARRREVIAAFLTAARSGDFAALLVLLDPDVVLRADPVAVRIGAAGRVEGAAAVAQTFCGRARTARLASADGVPEAVWPKRSGRPLVLFSFTIVDGRIAAIDLIGEPDLLDGLSVTLLER
jgi:RNA polymerase sigma-70 factor, ECF subfamily